MRDNPAAAHADNSETSVWAAVGGTPTFDRLVTEFYARVRKDELLSPMYPEDDWEGAAWRLRAFLEQYWGGPKTYSAERGHPRLRMRHNRFPIDQHARDRWILHMDAALAATNIAPLYAEMIRDHYVRAAYSLLNSYNPIVHRQ